MKEYLLGPKGTNLVIVPQRDTELFCGAVQSSKTQGYQELETGSRKARSNSVSQSCTTSS